MGYVSSNVRASSQYVARPRQLSLYAEISFRLHSGQYRQYMEMDQTQSWVMIDLITGEVNRDDE